MSTYRHESTLLSEDEVYTEVDSFVNPGSSMMASIILKNSGENPLTGLRFRLQREAGVIPQVLDPHPSLSDEIASNWAGALAAGAQATALLLIPPGKTVILARAESRSATLLEVWRASFPKETVLEPMLDGKPLTAFLGMPKKTPIYSNRVTVATDGDTVLNDVLAEGITNRRFLSLQVVGGTGALLVCNGSSTSGGTKGNLLDPIPTSGITGGYLEDTKYCGPVALRAVTAEVTVQVEVL